MIIGDSRLAFDHHHLRSRHDPALLLAIAELLLGPEYQPGFRLEILIGDRRQLGCSLQGRSQVLLPRHLELD